MAWAEVGSCGAPQGKSASVPVLIGPEPATPGCRPLFRVCSVDAKPWLESVSFSETHRWRRASCVVAGQQRFWLLGGERPRQDSNLRTRLRRPLLYPLSYGGGGSHENTSFASAACHRSDHENWLCGPMVASNLKHVAAYLGRVLVVDDSEIVRALIRVNLELEGFEVVTAVDGLDCLDKVLSVEPTLVTLDVVMPRLDGFSTAIRLREDQRTRHLPIVVITAAAQGRDLARGREIGVDAYITKPFEPGDLISTVRRLAVRRLADRYAREPTARER